MRKTFILVVLTLFFSGGLQAQPGQRVVIDRDDETPQASLKRRGRRSDELRANLQKLKRLQKLERNAMHFENDDSTMTSVIGAGMAFRDAQTGELKEPDPELSRTKNGWVKLGTAVDTIIRKKQTNRHEFIHRFTDPETKSHYRLGITVADVEYEQDYEFSFALQGVRWKLVLLDNGFDISAVVTARRGPRTYATDYEATHNMDLRTDPDGSIRGENVFSLTRAQMIGADGSVTPCSAWDVDSSRMSFSCDDSALPESAIPYVIDPTGNYSNSGAYNSGNQIHGYKTMNQAYPYTTTYTVGGDPGSACNTANHSAISAFTTRYCWLRFDTTGIPAGSTINSAILHLFTSGNWANYTLSGSASLTGRYYSAANWPIESADVQAAESGPFAASRVNNTISGNNVDLNLTLSNVGNIVAGGYTGMVFNDNQAGGDTTPLFLQIQTFAGSNPPYLTVDYTPPNATPSIASGPGLPANVNAGQWHTILVTFRDPDGYANLQYGHVLINYGVDGANACYVILYPENGHIGVLNDAQSSWQTAAVGTANHYPSNSRCVVDGVTSSRTNSGTDSTWTVKLYLTRDFLTNPRAANTYALIYDDSNASSGWTGAYTSSTVRSGPKLIITSTE